MLRRRIAFLTAVVLLLLTCPALAYEQKTATLHYDGISIKLDGQYLTPRDINGNEVNPFIIDGTTYLPIRAVAAALGLEVGWEQETQTIRLTSGAAADRKPGRPNQDYINKSEAEAVLKYPGITILLDGRRVEPRDVNGRAVDPFVIDGTTYLPIRAVASALGLTVQWEKVTKTVLLYNGSAQAAAGSHPEHAAYEKVLEEYRGYFTAPFGELGLSDDESRYDEEAVYERFPYIDFAQWEHIAVRYCLSVDHPERTMAECLDAGYAFYDLNGDGTDELLLRSIEGHGLGSIYSWNGMDAMLCLRAIGGNKQFSYVHKDGTVSVFWAGGGASEERYRLADDGFSASLTETIGIPHENREAVFMTPPADEADIPWRPLFPEG